MHSTTTRGVSLGRHLQSGKSDPQCTADANKLKQQECAKLLCKQLFRTVKRQGSDLSCERDDGQIRVRDELSALHLRHVGHPFAIREGHLQVLQQRGHHSVLFLLRCQCRLLRGSL